MLASQEEDDERGLYQGWLLPDNCHVQAAQENTKIYVLYPDCFYTMKFLQNPSDT